MTDATTTRWVVLLQKAPRGPLTGDEVRALIDEGLLRMNDLAMEIPAEKSASGKTDWKLLWQFPQFNRRAPRNPEEAGAQAVPPEEQRKRDERRKPAISPEEQKRLILENLPPEIAAINASDLALTSTRTLNRLEDDTRTESSNGSSSFGEASRWRMVASIAALALVGVLVFGLVATRTPEPARTGASDNATPAGSARVRRPGMANNGPVSSDRASRLRRPGMTGLPTGADLQRFDTQANVMRPHPESSPVAAPNNDDSGDYSAPAPRRPRVIRPGTIVEDDTSLQPGPEDSLRPPRRPARANRPAIQDDDNNNDDAANAVPEEAADDDSNDGADDY